MPIMYILIIGSKFQLTINLLDRILNESPMELQLIMGKIIMLLELSKFEDAY